MKDKVIVTSKVTVAMVRSRGSLGLTHIPLHFYCKGITQLSFHRLIQ
jgi:hypothetical protein